jgi:hypothetical protein
MSTEVQGPGLRNSDPANIAKQTNEIIPTFDSDFLSLPARLLQMHDQSHRSDLSSPCFGKSSKSSSSISSTKRSTVTAGFTVPVSKISLCDHLPVPTRSAVDCAFFESAGASDPFGPDSLDFSEMRVI